VRRLVLGTLALAVILGGLILLPTRASAHALRQSSDPADGAVLDQSPTAVTITFNEEPDPGLSRIDVLDTSGQSHDAALTQAVPGSADQLTVAVHKLANGVYTVSWRTVSRVDGHSAAGTFAFGVGVSQAELAKLGTGASSSFSGSSPMPGALAIAGRWSLYAGLLVLVGFAAAGTLVFAAPPPPTLVLLPAAWMVAASGTLLVVGAQARDAGVGFSNLLTTSIGHNLIERAIPLGAAGVALLIALMTRARARRWAVAALGVGAASSMLVDVLLGHAAAGSDNWVNSALQWVHILAVGVWIGGLAALLLGVRGAPSGAKARAVRRFSFTAGIALAVVAASGLVRAFIEIGAWNRVTSTAFGQLVLVKAGLLLALAGLGAVNRYRHVPVSTRILRGLRRVGSTELAVAALAVLVTSALVNVSPPAASVSAAPSRPQPIVVSGSDDATTVRVRLTVSPGMAGFNQFTVSVVDYDTGSTVDAAGVQLQFAFVASCSIGGSTLDTKRQPDGTWSATGDDLSLDGTWTVTALVERGAASTEVPLQVTTRSAPQTVTVSRFPGLPTLYTIHLSQSRSLQVYLDPDKPGNDNFHSTFFDAQGNEMPVSSATITMTAPGGRTTNLSPTRLGPGHFAAPATIAQGSYRFDITGTTTGCGTLMSHIDLTPGSQG